MGRYRKKEHLQQKKWGADEKKACTVICGGFLFLLLCTFLGEWKREKNAEHLMRTEAVFQAEQKTLVTPSNAYQHLLIELEEKMEGENIHQAAEQLRKEWEKMEELFAQMPKKSILYAEKGNIVDSLEGMGLAIREDKTCFYGSFYQGKPQGVCTAVSCKNRFGYQYSAGTWKAGQMEGPGITGNVCLTGKDSLTDRKIAKEQVFGMFSEDKLDGSFTYRQTDAQGADRWWTMTAQKGRTCLDKRWSFKEEIEEYRLLSETEGNVMFVVPKNEMHNIWWKNRVSWEDAP